MFTVGWATVSQCYMMLGMSLSVAIYARISSDHEGAGLGVQRQVEECQKIADRLGYEVVDVYVDRSVSAHSGRTRPEYVRMLEDMCDRRFGGVVATAMDRLHRRPLEQEEFFAICKNVGVTVVQTMGGPVDLGSYMGLGMARFGGLLASMESDIKSERSLSKHAQLAADGKISGGGARPFGYEDDRRTIVPDEAAVITEAALRALAGDSVRSICADFNDRRIATASGKAWNPSVMSKMLRSARLSGQREHKGEIVGPAEWPGIITAEQTAGLRAALGAGRGAVAPHPRRYLLPGLLRCSHCGATLVSRPRVDGTRQYVCANGPGHTGCGKLSVLADPVELLIVDGVTLRLDTPAFARTVERGVKSNKQAEQWRIKEAEATARIEELGKDFGDGTISRTAFLAALPAAEAKRDQARRKLSQIRGTTVLDGYVGNGEQLRAAWDGMDLERQHAIVKGVLDHAVVHPAVRGRNRFDESRITPVWK